MDWKKEIVIANFVKQKLAEVDSRGLWSHPFPELAAADEEIFLVESKLKFPLDEELRQFLLHANGWKYFFQDIDLFAVKDFLNGPRFDRAAKILESLDDLQEVCGVNKNDLLPFAVSMSDVDLFVIAKKNSDSPGVVFWFAGQMVDKFSDFNEWFLSMVDYSRREYVKVLSV